MNPIEKALAQAEKIQAANRDLEEMSRPKRYDQCDDTCTVDCGHCKGAGRPATWADVAESARIVQEAERNVRLVDEPVCPYPDGIWF